MWGVSLDGSLEAEVRAVDWDSLGAAYGPATEVPDLILGLASSERERVAAAYSQLGEMVLWHQGAVYPATVEAARLMCRIAHDPDARFRGALITELTMFAVGYDDPSSPPGTAAAVRDAIRAPAESMLKLWAQRTPVWISHSCYSASHTRLREPD
jgi:hypothetical protein